MKKNAMLKIAAILLVAVLLTTCAISATFAKYVTSTTEIDASARVAKWGITAEVTLKNTGVFKNAYVDDAGEQIVFNTSDLLVAPGTKVEDAIEISVVFDGTPEVDYTIVSDFALENYNTEWKAGSVEYFPITLVVNSTEINPDGDMTFAEAKAAFATAVNGAFANATDDVTVTIGWYWASDVDDANDTLLGNAGTAKVGFSGAITIEQVIADDGFAE